MIGKDALPSRHLVDPIMPQGAERWNSRETIGQLHEFSFSIEYLKLRPFKGGSSACFSPIVSETTELSVCRAPSA
jgi:hypothetical protein